VPKAKFRSAGGGRADEAADNRAAEQSGLAAAFAKSGSHWQHPAMLSTAAAETCAPSRREPKLAGADFTPGQRGLLSSESDQKV
jgi:hypothetical protein